MSKRRFSAAFRIFWLTHTAALFGDVLYAAGMMWFVYKATGSALATTGVPLIDVLTRLVGGLFAGPLADRRVRTRWMAEIHVAKMLLVAGVAIALTAGVLRPWMIYVLTIAFTLMTTFYEPTYAALLPHLVAASGLTQANAVLHISRTLAYGLSWLISGVLLARLSAPTVAGWNASVFGLAVLGFLLLHIFNRHPTETEATRLRPVQVLHDVRDAARRIWEHPWLRALLWISLPGWLTIGLWGPLQLVFLDRVLGAGPQSWGLMQAAFFLSGLAGSLLASVLTGLLPGREGGWMAAVALLHGGLTVLFGLAPNVFVALVAVVLAGATDPFFLAAREAVLQHTMPDAVRGRVLAVWGMLLAASSALSYFLTGLLADFLPLRGLYALAGVALSLAYLWTTWQTPLLQTRIEAS